MSAKDSDVATLRLLFAGGGFDSVRVSRNTHDLTLHATRAHTLPDWLRRNLRVLICGLNPSPYAAQTGLPFGRPGNRFWPAAIQAGIVERDRDLEDALRLGIGFTDLVKRTTSASSEINSREYKQGLVRLEHVAEIYTPKVICFVGLEGVRKALHTGLVAGHLERKIGGCRAYLMPSTSGRNANTTLDQLADHLRTATT